MRAWDLFAAQNESGDLDLEHYHATGGMNEALSRHADEVYGDLPDPEHQRLAQSYSSRSPKRWMPTEAYVVPWR